jgi:co-chaperonin GroES (HSP10)
MREGLVLPSKLIIKELERVEEVRTSGIIVPGQLKKNETLAGKVVLKGSACMPELELGMVVLYPRLSATKFEIEGDTVALLDERSVLFAYHE